MGIFSVAPGAGRRAGRRLPASLVTGFSAPDQARLVAGWLARKPAGEHWAVLFNGRRPPGIGPPLLPESACAQLAGGCACCAARIAFGVTLDRLLARSDWDRLLVLLDPSGHASGMVDLLRSGACRDRLVLDEVVAVVEPLSIDALLDDSKEVLAIDQIECADRLVIMDASPARSRKAQAAAQRLAVRAPFFRVVEAAPLEHAAPPGSLVPDWPDREPPHVGLQRWRWSPEVGFDRASLVAASRQWADLPGLIRGRAAFRTARDTYLWSQGAGQGDSQWVATGWRRDSRLELDFGPDGGPDAALLEAIERSVSAALRSGASPLATGAGPLRA